MAELLKAYVSGMKYVLLAILFALALGGAVWLAYTLFGEWGAAVAVFLIFTTPIAIVFSDPS